MLTVKQVADLTGVTIKTLHHYHKKGLLEPCKISEAGYRLYGKKELEVLQHILFYRELDFSLVDIQKLIEEKSNRLAVLQNQKTLMQKKNERIARILNTINETVYFEETGKNMNEKDMFKGLNKKQWEEQLAFQNEHLKAQYNYTIPSDKPDMALMGDSAVESSEFMAKMALALKEGWCIEDPRVKHLLKKHIAYINDNIMRVDAKMFVESAWFFMTDEFHKNMLEAQQVGLSYYIYASAVNYAG